MKTFTAKLTQYMRPDGRQQAVETELPVEVLGAYKHMENFGCRLECEVLRTGEVSVTVTHPDMGDIDISVNPNGPEVHEGLVRMLNRRVWRRAVLKPVCRFWVYWHEGIVRIKVTRDKEVCLATGGRTDEGWTFHGERYYIEDGVLRRDMEDDGVDCDGRHSRSVSLGWVPSFGEVPCIDHLSDGTVVELKEYRPDWREFSEARNRDHSAEAAGY